MDEPRDHPLLATFAEHRCSAILRTPHAEAVGPAMDAAIEGGFRIVEFTLNTPGALDHVRRCAAEKDLCVGAGTVLSVADAEQALEAGAQFLVSPVADRELLEYCREHALCVIPGVLTPNEMLAAHHLGAPLLKLFPGPADGPAYLRTIRGPLPFLRVFPTSGVTLDNVADWFAAGAFGVGFVNCLFENDDLANGRFGAIRERAEQMVGAVRALG